MGMNMDHVTPWHNDKLQPNFGIKILILDSQQNYKSRKMS